MILFIAASATIHTEERILICCECTSIACTAHCGIFSSLYSTKCVFSSHFDPHMHTHSAWEPELPTSKPGHEQEHHGVQSKAAQSF